MAPEARSRRRCLIGFPLPTLASVTALRPNITPTAVVTPAAAPIAMDPASSRPDRPERPERNLLDVNPFRPASPDPDSQTAWWRAGRWSASAGSPRARAAGRGGAAPAAPPANRAD